MTGKGKSKDKSAVSKSNPIKFGKYEFYPGAKLEAMDFLKNWYPAKVIRVKEEEKKILIHFEGWNQRYDEWMPFSSDKIRPLIRQSGRRHETHRKVKDWRCGDTVRARWSDAKYYPAKVIEDLDDGTYKVQFYDGFEKIVAGSTLKKEDKKSFEVYEKETSSTNDEDSASSDKTVDGARAKRRHVEPVSMADFVTELKKPRISPSSTSSSPKSAKDKFVTGSSSAKTSPVAKGDRLNDSANEKQTSTNFTDVKSKRATNEPTSSGASYESVDSSACKIPSTSSRDADLSPKLSKTGARAGSTRPKQVLRVKFFPQGKKSRRSLGAAQRSSESDSAQGSSPQKRTSPSQRPSSGSSLVSSKKPGEPSSSHSTAKPLPLDGKVAQKFARLKYTKSKLDKQQEKSAEAKMRKLKKQHQMAKQLETAEPRRTMDEPIKTGCDQLSLDSSQVPAPRKVSTRSTFSFSPEDDEKLSVLKSHTACVAIKGGNPQTPLETAEVCKVALPMADMSSVLVERESRDSVENPQQVIVLDENNTPVTASIETAVATSVAPVINQPKRRRVRSRRPRKEMEIASMVVQEWPSTKRPVSPTFEISNQNEISFVANNSSLFQETAAANRFVQVKEKSSAVQAIAAKLRRKSRECLQKNNGSSSSSPVSYDNLSTGPTNVPHRVPTMMMPGGQQSFDNPLLQSPVECRDPYCTVAHKLPSSSQSHVHVPYYPQPYIPASGMGPAGGQYTFIPGAGVVSALPPLSIPRDQQLLSHRSPNVLPVNQVRMVIGNDTALGPRRDGQMPQSGVIPADNVSLLQITKVESRAKDVMASTTQDIDKVCPVEAKESAVNAKVNTVEFKVKKKRLDLITNKLTAQRQSSATNSAENSPAASPPVSRSLSDPELYPARSNIEHQPSPPWPHVERFGRVISPPPQAHAVPRLPLYNPPMGMLPSARHPAAARLMTYASAYKDMNASAGFRPMTVLSTNLLYAPPSTVAMSSPRFPPPVQQFMYPTDINQPGFTAGYPVGLPYPNAPNYQLHGTPYQGGPVARFEYPPRGFGRPLMLSGHPSADYPAREHRIHSTEGQLLKGSDSFPRVTQNNEDDKHSLPSSSSHTQVDTLYSSGRMKYVPLTKPYPPIPMASTSPTMTREMPRHQTPPFDPLLLAHTNPRPSANDRTEHTAASSSYNSQSITGETIPRDRLPVGPFETDSHSKDRSINTAAFDFQQRDEHHQPKAEQPRNATPFSQGHGCAEPGGLGESPCEATKKTRKLSDKTLAPKEFVVQVDLNEFKCTVADCDKSFRKSHLLDYHIKYYHSPRPEEVKRKRSTASLSSPECGSIKPHSGDGHPSKRQHRHSESQDVTKQQQQPDNLSTETVASQIVVDDVTSECEREYSDDDSTVDSDADTDSSEIDDVIRCKCHEIVEQGFMIQCEQCLTWQHGDCVGLAVSTVPSKYLCYICTNPKGLRRGAKYNNDFDWFRLGKLPPLTPARETTAEDCKAADVITATHALMEDISNIRAVLRAIQLKLAQMNESPRVNDAMGRAAESRQKGTSSVVNVQPKTSLSATTDGNAKNDTACPLKGIVDRPLVDGCSQKELERYLLLLDETERLEKQLEGRMDRLEKHVEVLEVEYRKVLATASWTDADGRETGNDNSVMLKSAELTALMKQITAVSKMVSGIL